MATAVLVFVSFLGLDIWLFRSTWQVVYPLGDEFSLIAESSRLSFAWLLSGYSRYFIPYPEYFVPYTNFIRPTANLVYWVFAPWSATSYRGQLVIVNYGVHSAIAAGVFYASRRILRNARGPALTLGVAAYAAAAFFNSSMPRHPSFALDGIAALCCLAAILFVATGRETAGVACLLVAVFTKEAALPVALAVAGYGAWFRRRGLLLATAAVVAAYAGLRWAAFGQLGGVSGLHQPSIRTIGLSTVYALSLPFAYVARGSLKSAFLSGHFDVSLLFAVANIGVAALCAKLAWAYARTTNAWRVRNLDDFDDGNAPIAVLSLLSVVASTAFFILIRGEARFAYVFFVALLVFVAALPGDGSRRVLIAGLAVVGSLGPVIAARDAHGGDEIYAYQYRGAAALIATLNDLDPGGGPVYVVNDFVGGHASPRNVAAFAGVDYELRRGSSVVIWACPVSRLHEIAVTATRTEAGSSEVQISLPDCAGFDFEGANNDKLLAAISGGNVRRNSQIAYALPDIRISETPVFGGSRVESFGRRMTVMIQGGRVIYFDFGKGEWVLL